MSELSDAELMSIILNGSLDAIVEGRSIEDWRQSPQLSGSSFHSGSKKSVQSPGLRRSVEAEVSMIRETSRVS
jgi:hypothetical protein